VALSAKLGLQLSNNSLSDLFQAGLPFPRAGPSNLRVSMQWAASVAYSAGQQLRAEQAPGVRVQSPRLARASALACLQERYLTSLH
jgi:hypothetical protein